MLNVPNTHEKGHLESFGDHGYVCYLDCSDSKTGICICVIHQNVYIKYVQFGVLLCFNQAIKNKNETQ